MIKALSVSIAAAVALAALVTADNSFPARARSRHWLEPEKRPAIPVGKRVEIPTPLGLPPVPIPEDNPPTEETIGLGRKLFFDPILSVDGSISCSSCHDPKTAFTDGRRVSLGVGKALGVRNAMTILNAAYHPTQFWDGRARSLEEQAAGPIPNELEFAHSIPGVERKLSADPDYVRLFAAAFGPGRITFEMVAKSIASFERTLLSGNSPFDRYYYGGDKSALSESAVRGLHLFLEGNLDSPNCAGCHKIGEQFATFTEPRFHNTGVAWQPEKRTFSDLGRFRVSGDEKERGAFKVPTLRNIALTAPYMHDGSIATLEEVVDFYFQGGRNNPQLSGVMPHAGVPNIPKEQQPQAKKDLVEFMKALTGEMPRVDVPSKQGK